MNMGRKGSFVLLALLSAALFAPALTGFGHMFHDDQAFDVFTKYFFLARCLKAGAVPLWDPHTWCGAVPFFARYYTETWYLPLWPFLILAPLGQMAAAYKTIVLLPAAAHFLLAAAGMSVLLSRRMRLGTGAAFCGAALYILSPAMSYAYGWHQVVYLQAWAPWLLYLFLRACDRFRPGLWVGAAVVCALTITAASPGTWFVPLGLCCGAFVFRIISALKRKDLAAAGRIAIAAAFVALAGAGLGAVYLFPFADGMALTREHIPLTAAAALNEPGGSLQPLFLLTVLLPNLFGSVTGTNLPWLRPEPMPVFWDANLMGGLFLSFAATLAVVAAVKTRATDSDRTAVRRWTFALAAMFVLALLCALGRHSPFYAATVGRIPLLGQLPRPVRYRFFECFAFCGLAAAGIDCLLSGAQVFIRETLRPSSLARVFALCAAMLCLLAMAVPAHGEKRPHKLWDGLPNNAYEGRFNTDAEPDMLLDAAGETAPSEFLRPGPFANSRELKKICAVAFRCSAGFSGQLAWRAPGAEREKTQTISVAAAGWHEIGTDIEPGAQVALRPDAGADVSFALVPRPMRYLANAPARQSLFFRLALEEPVRSAFNILVRGGRGRDTVVFNLAYLAGAPLLLCLVFARTARGGTVLAAAVVAEALFFAAAAMYNANFCYGAPAQNHLRAAGPESQALAAPALEFFGNAAKNPMLRAAAGNPFMDNYARVAGSFALMGYEMHPLEARVANAFERAYEKPMNYFVYYTNARPAPRNRALLDNFAVNRFLDTGKDKVFTSEAGCRPLDDSGRWQVHMNARPLARARLCAQVRVETEGRALADLCQRRLDGCAIVGKRDKEKIPARAFGAKPGTAGHVVAADFSGPNRIALDVDAESEGMLVIADTWYPDWAATVDGEDAEVFRVNYCQRGLWLGAGRHKAELVFRPAAHARGLWTSAGCAGMLALLWALSGAGGRRKNKN